MTALIVLGGVCTFAGLLIGFVICALLMANRTPDTICSVQINEEQAKNLVALFDGTGSVMTVALAKKEDESSMLWAWDSETPRELVSLGVSEARM